ncbi:MAG: DegT/DnrJ/EryC1/StrS family aminotransferase [Clostridiales bacterium]|nr:DegT/DnrJ/EryC1/StrS family aminotransferase [Clostridiales bacterium]
MKFTDFLTVAAARDKIRLHTPGHKGKLAALDLTELTDGSFPDPALKAAEKRAAAVYGARHARYLSGGSSQGVKAAVLYAGKSAVVDVNSHRSVFDGFFLSGKRFVTAGTQGSVYPLTIKQIEGALTSDTGAVVLTSPTYYGFCADIDGIAEFCKRRGLLFIVDSAHGAHFGFSDLLPNSAAPRCDICNVSTHKTLSALTQTALLLDNLSEDESAKLNGCADVMGTTSPSYLLYASIDHAIIKAADKTTSSAYSELFAPIDDIKSQFPFLRNDDFTRLVLDCSALGVTPSKLNAALCRRGVYSELVSDKYIVFIFTADNVPSDAEALRNELAASIREIE